jgi:6-phosphofructokinase 2
VALTLGEQGALVATASGVLRSPALPVPLVSAVGAGDSFLAGLVWALERGSDLETALRYGVAAGAAAVTRAGTMLAAPADIVRLVAKVEVSAVVR